MVEGLCGFSAPILPGPEHAEVVLDFSTKD